MNVHEFLVHLEILFPHVGTNELHNIAVIVEGVEVVADVEACR